MPVRHDDPNINLFKAFHSDDPALLDHLLTSYHINPHVRDPDGKSLLHLAIEKNALSVIKYLTSSHNFDLNQRDPLGETALDLAISFGHVNLVKYFIEDLGMPYTYHNRDTSPFSPRHRYHSFHIAIRNNHLGVVRYLVDNAYIPPDYRSCCLRYPVCIAALFGHTELVDYFVAEQHFDLSKLGSYYGSALDHAVRGGHLDLVKRLIEYYAMDPLQISNHGSTTFHYAACLNKVAIIDYLVNERGPIDLYHKSPRRLNALNFAAANGSLAAVKYLIEVCGMDPSRDRGLRMTPLYAAVLNNQLEVITYLIEEVGMTPMRKGGEGNSLIRLARINKHFAILEYLLACRAKARLRKRDYCRKSKVKTL